jgi:hypothetical protein
MVLWLFAHRLIIGSRCERWPLLAGVRVDHSEMDEDSGKLC